MIKPVIMAGGSGSRLWPLSRAMYPKQFLSLDGESLTMLQKTLLRLSSLDVMSPIVICNEEHRFIVAEQLREIDVDASIILEPVGRNTAPAISLAANLAIEEDPLLLVLAADHIIESDKEFTETINNSITLANDGKLVTFGVVPTEPNTGYGYIKRGMEVGAGFEVESFIEKPDQETAQGYFSSKEFLWNSGMFMFKASIYLTELKKFRSDIYDICESAFKNKYNDLDFIRIDNNIFEHCPAESIDYALMEKTSEAVVVPLNTNWNDIGSWSSLWEISQKDRDANAVYGDAILQETSNSYIYGNERLITTIGIDDLIIVDTKDALLIAAKDKVQNVKKLVETLKSNKRSEYKTHREVYRPWGKYDSIDNGSRYQVKRITVKPGEKLSLQMHHHRAEHWIVVSGTAKVTNGDKTFILTEDQSTYIPIGATHALENPGKVMLEMIEVQSGSYLGEDDIVRYEDKYGRL